MSKPPEHALAQLLDMITGKWVTQCVATFAKLGVADRLAPAPQLAAELASPLGLHPGALYRLLRALSVVGVVEEGADQRFTLTEIGQLLRKDVPGSLAAFAVFMGEGWHSSFWAELEHSVRTGEAAVPKVTGTSVWDFLRAHPDAQATFNEAMLSVTNLQVPDVVASYDFSTARRILDVGGGLGRFLAGILDAVPTARGVLLDVPQVAASARRALAARGLADRVEVVGGSFLDGIPGGCDLVTMKLILHDWPDAEAVQILSHARAGLPDGGRVLVIEEVLPGPGVPHPCKILDLEMLVITPGGLERTEEQYAALFERAGLRLSRVITTTWTSILEAIVS